MKRFLSAIAAFAFASTMIACSGSDDNGDGGNGTTEPTGKSLILASNEATFLATNADDVTIGVTTDAESWAIGESADWYTAVKSDDGSEIVISANNNDGEARTHALTITAPGAEDKTINVSQAAYKAAHASLTGSQYIVIHVGETANSIIKDKIIHDLRPTAPEESTEGVEGSFLYDWAQTWQGATSTGPNFYGDQEGWVGFTTNAGAGWTGGAYNHCGTRLPDLSVMNTEPEKWFFHIAVKASPDHITTFGLDFNNAPLYTFTVGGNGANYSVNLNEWTEIEIPLTEILATGWKAQDLKTSNKGHNGLYFNNGVDVASALAGKEFHFDAAFFYKK